MPLTRPSERATPSTATRAPEPPNRPRRPERVPLTGAVRVLLAVFAALTALAVVVLYGFPARTDELFAWTIQPPLTAAFFGAGYGGGCVLVLLARREGDWAVARIPYLTVLVFVVLTLVATVVHLDSLHFDAAAVVARVAAWLWFVVYLAVPVAMAAALPAQRRPRMPDAPARRRLPGWLRLVVSVQAAVMLVTGAALFASPPTVAPAWPWTLTPFTARVVAAWLVALGVAAVLALRAGDLARLRTPAAAYAVIGTLQVGALVRYPAELAWQGPSAWVYAAMSVAVAATGIYGWRAGRHRDQAATPKP